jgi:hypothetical protein
MGNKTPSCEEGGLGEATLAGFLCRRFAAGFFFMILFPALNLTMPFPALFESLRDAGATRVCS